MTPPPNISFALRKQFLEVLWQASCLRALTHSPKPFFEAICVVLGSLEILWIWLFGNFSWKLNCRKRLSKSIDASKGLLTDTMNVIPEFMRLQTRHTSLRSHF